MTENDGHTRAYNNLPACRDYDDLGAEIEVTEMYEEIVANLRNCSEVNSLSWYKRELMKQAADAIEELSMKRTGVWITPRKNYCKCSVCGTGFHHSVGVELDNYCAECGAKMKGEIEMRKIDACPYCGCEDAYIESYEHHIGAIRYRVCCPKCGVYLDSGYWQTADRAVEEWNKRSNSMWWIPTKKQYPFAEYGEGKNVLTVDSMGVKRVLYFDGGNWCWPSGEVLETARAFPVTHWMPLPQPPTECRQMVTDSNQVFGDSEQLGEPVSNPYMLGEQEET